MSELLTIKEASSWATKYLKKEVTTSNISYLIKYGRIPSSGDNGNTLISKAELKKYYERNNVLQEDKWKAKLGSDLNWNLSFSNFKESETTKHVHRLHPYKGKFIPQLVAYFLDSHTDEFKKKVFFNKGDIILDPFCGSGTTLVQANELGINAIGVDVSSFNALISNAKVGKYNLEAIQNVIQELTDNLKQFISEKKNLAFENRLLEKLKHFNDRYFPSPEFKYKVRNGIIDEKRYGAEKEAMFLPIFKKLLDEYNIRTLQNKEDTFLDKWYIKEVRDEIDFMFEQIKKIKSIETKRILSIILSRTIRSCRATTHSDLATLVKPQTTTYYCKKHGKICKPIFTILNWWERYTKDTINRLKDFENLRTNTKQICFTGDSRDIDLYDKLKKKKDTGFLEKLKTNKIDGIFSSPPYVGLIDYHEQHAYSYDLYGFERKDDLEIGPLYKGQGKEARDSYVEGIARVLNNCKQYLKNDFNVFLVANDKYNLYPKIAQKSGMTIVNQYKRPVLNRVEKDRNAYAEIIFHMKRP